MKNSERLKILIIGNTLCPQLAGRTQCFVRQGHIVGLITGVEDFTLEGVGNIVPRGLPLGNFWRLIALTRIVDFIRKVNRFNPDLIIIHYAGGLWAWLSIIFNKPYVVGVMGGDVLFDEQKVSSRMERKATRALIQNASLILAKSSRLFEMIKSIGGKKNIIIFNWGIGNHFAHESAKDKFLFQFRKKPDEQIILSPRQMRPLYNIPVIIHAFSIICQRRINVRLLLSTYNAEKKYLSEIKQLIIRLGIEDSVELLPPLEGKDMPALYYSSDIVVSIPSSDGMPQTFQEASACRIPIVMSDLPAYSDIIVDKKNALVVPVEANAVADALQNLLLSVSLRQQITNNANKLFKKNGFIDKNTTILEKRLYVVSKQKMNISIFVRLSQVFTVLKLLFSHQAIVSKTSQPIIDNLFFRHYFKKKKEHPVGESTTGID